ELRDIRGCVHDAIGFRDRVGCRRVLDRERSKRQRVEYLEAALTRATPVADGIRLEVDRHVDADARELATLACRLDMGEERLAVALLRDFGRMRDQVLERSV